MDDNEGGADERERDLTQGRNRYLRPKCNPKVGAIESGVVKTWRGKRQDPEKEKN